jgi:hypothetical protein
MPGYDRYDDDVYFDQMQDAWAELQAEQLKESEDN